MEKEPFAENLAVAVAVTDAAVGRPPLASFGVAAAVSKAVVVVLDSMAFHPWILPFVSAA